MTIALADLGSTIDPLDVARAFCEPLSIERLGGERDANYKVTATTGAEFVLKLVDEREAGSSIPLQVAALEHLAREAPTLAVPRVVPTRGGQRMLALGRSGAWMLGFRPGRLLHEIVVDRATLARLGALAIELGEGLRDFQHSALHRHVEWAVDLAGEASRYVRYVADGQLRGLVDRALTAFARQADDLPRQAVHGDLNPHNLIVDGRGEITGILDFGDLHHGTRLTEVAVALAYHLSNRAFPAAVDAVLGATWLTAEERAALPAFLAARCAMTIAIAEHRASLRPGEREYLTRNVSAAADGLRWLAQGGDEHLKSLLGGSR